MRAAALRWRPLLRMGVALALTGGGEGIARAAHADEPVRIALAERLEFADVSDAPTRVAMGDGARLTSGWYALERPPGAVAFRWTRQRSAVLEVPRVRPEPLRLRLDVDPARVLFRDPAASPRQTLRILWNGRDAGAFELPLGAPPLEIEVPAAWQRIGPNRIELLPSYWLNPRANLLGRDDRNLGVRVRSIELADGAGARTGAGNAPGARAERDAIRQRPGSVATFGLALPEGARLRGEVALAGDANALRDVRVALALLDEADQGAILLEWTAREIAAAGSLPVDVDLAAWGGELVALSASASGSSAGAGEIEWRNLAIEGRRPVPPKHVPAGVRGRYNALVLLLDSLRADHVEPVAPPSSDTPHIRRLAEAGVAFPHARTNSSWTRPAVVSMLSGLLPAAHGVASMDHAMAATIPYLPQMLAENGWATAAVIDTFVVSPYYGLQRGFDVVHPFYELRRERRAAPGFSPESEARFVWESYLEPLVRRAGEKPFFAYVHEIDPHTPYAPPPPYDTGHGPALPANFDLTFETLVWTRLDPGWLEPGDVDWLHGRYRGEVSSMDRYVGFLLDRLEERGLAKRTLVALVSDHGEEFWEHRSLGHGHTVFEEQLRVPLVLALPGVLPAGRRPAVAAELVDLAPTILDLLGLPVPEDAQGRSLLPEVFAADGEAGVGERASLAHSENDRHHALLFRHWKLVRRNPDDPARDAADLSLFDLDVDPGERIDLWSRRTAVATALRQRLDRELAAARRQRVDAPLVEHLGLEELEALRALGYVP